MYRPRDLKGALFNLALSALFFYYAWDHWGQIRALEAGQNVHVKMWAPLAWIYNQGGIWMGVAKWTGQIGTVLLALFCLAFGLEKLGPNEPEPQARPETEPKS